MRSCKAWTLLGALTLSGCSAAYKQAVVGYASHQREYTRAITECKKTNGSYPDLDTCIQSYAFPMSGLECLVDEDTKKSTNEQMSVACKCSRAADAAQRTAACTAWLETN